jgi:hypothetical protein
MLFDQALYYFIKKNILSIFIAVDTKISMKTLFLSNLNLLYLFLYFFLKKEKLLWRILTK